MLQFVVHNWYLFAALVVVLALLAAEPLKQLLYRVSTVTPSRAVQLINRDGVVVDVREPSEFASGHLPNAINIPVGNIHMRLNELEKHKNRPIVVYCRSGQRSARAAVVLRKHGFEQVHNLAGGVVAWQNDSLPTER